MKRTIKYILAFFLIFIAFIATSERFVFHLTHFEQTYGEITFEYSIYGEKDQKQLIKNNVIKDLQDKEFDVYKVDTEYVSDYYMKKTIYGTPNAIKHLQSLGINNGKYSSMFIGNIEILFLPIEQLDHIYETDVFRFIGTYEQAAEFKNIQSFEMNNYYQVTDIKETSGSEDGVYATLYLIWGIAFAFILLISFYTVILTKKEIMVKLTLGVNPIRTFIEHSLCDIVIFSLFFFGLSSILELFFHVRYKFIIICILFSLLLILNTLINLTMIKVSLKKDMSNAVGNKGALIATYIVKAICLLMTIIVLSANSIIVFEAISYFKQSEFFEDKEAYNYYRFYYSVSTSNRENISEIQDHERMDYLWNDFDKTFGNSAICTFDLSDTFDTEAILINNNAIKNLNYSKNSELISKISGATKNKIYVFLPDKTIYSEKTIIPAIRTLFLKGESDKEIIIDTYKGNANLVAINKTTNTYRSTQLKRPIIVLDMLESSYTERYLNPKYYGENMLYRISDDEFNLFSSKHSLLNEIVTVTNSRKLYLHNYSGFERNIRLMAAISVLICVLEFMMIIFFVNLEYINHGLELAIKKTLGYGIFLRNIKIFLVPLIIIPLCSIVAYIIISISRFGNIVSSIIISLLLLIVELFFTAYRCSIIERKNISNILKGEQS